MVVSQTVVVSNNQSLMSGPERSWRKSGGYLECRVIREPLVVQLLQMDGHGVQEVAQRRQHGAHCHLHAPCTHGANAAVEIGLSDVIGHGFVHLDSDVVHETSLVRG